MAITDDSVLESDVESFTLQLDLFRKALSSAILSPNISTIKIIDNDGKFLKTEGIYIY